MNTTISKDNLRWALLTIVVSIGLSFGSVLYALDKPHYIIYYGWHSDTSLVVLESPSIDGMVYANFVGSRDKRQSEVVDSLYITEPTLVTAWAENSMGECSDTINIVVDNREITDYNGELPPPVYDMPVVALHFDEFANVKTSYSGEEVDINDDNNTFRIVSVGQDILFSAQKTSPYIGDDYGPRDIYAAKVTDHALVFGNRNGSQTPAYIQTRNSIMSPFRVNINMTANLQQGQAESVAVLISEDGAHWTSVDTLGTDQLKPIRRLSCYVDGNASYYVRIESSTRARELSTMLFDIWITSSAKQDTGVETVIPSSKTLVKTIYYDMMGRRTNEVGGVLVRVNIYSDGSRTTEKIIR